MGSGMVRQPETRGGKTGVQVSESLKIHIISFWAKLSCLEEEVGGVEGSPEKTPPCHLGKQKEKKWSEHLCTWDPTTPGLGDDADTEDNGGGRGAKRRGWKEGGGEHSGLHSLAA